VAGVTVQTASGHLTKLSDAGLLTAEKQGRHRYFRLSGADVAQVLEALMGLAQRTGAVRVRTGPKDAALREARICYDHLAGEAGVTLFNGLTARNYLEHSEQDALQLTSEGREFFSGLGLELKPLESKRRPLCLHCLDWSERRHHLGGALGAAVLDMMLERNWLRREQGRALHFTPAGRQEFSRHFSCIW
jgi:hypothetical protein